MPSDYIQDLIDNHGARPLPQEEVDAWEQVGKDAVEEILNDPECRDQARQMIANRVIVPRVSRP